VWLEDKRFKKPACVRQMPFHGTGPRHGLNDEILHFQRLAQAV
jgi:hypothetical protein